MRNLIISTVIILTALSCKAQSPIIPLDNAGLAKDGAYYKDVDQDFDNYVGTWSYSNGNERFKIILKKKEQVYFSDPSAQSYYEDILYGEYRYVNENGQEIVNTLNQIDQTIFPQGSPGHLIRGNLIVSKYQIPVTCNDCNYAPGERIIALNFKNPNQLYLHAMIFLQYIDNSTPKIKLYLGSSEGTIVVPNDYTRPEIPKGFYTLTKQ